MARAPKKQFVCNVCSTVTTKWSGKCESCGSWNSIEEAENRINEMSGVAGKPLKGVTLKEVNKAKHQRTSTGIKPIDGLLGGGVVKGSVLLMAGEPGIGKSTLLMQIAGHMAKAGQVLYVSAEESVSQVGSRAKRLGVASNLNLTLSDSATVEDVAATIESGGYGLVIVDSVQTMLSQRTASAAGSVSQVTAVGQILSRAAKKSNTALILVGHVTKEGTIAGPKVLEHLVDVVLNIEGDRFGTIRILRSRKNRYGPTDELLLLDMQEDGLKPVASPSKELLRERQVSDGSVILAALDGNQPILVEVQALVTPTNFGYPKRTAVGFDLNRLNLLVAMLNRRTKLKLDSHDIYLNIVGGFRISDPGADLAVCMAIATAAKSMQLKDDAAVFGEVGLSGEVRHVPGAKSRVKEAKNMGIKRVIGPRSANLRDKEFAAVRNIRDALNENLTK